MITVEQAENIILSQTIDWGVETIDLSSVIERVLAEDILADRPFPPFDRVCMDGIAIDYNSYIAGIRAFKVETISPAGKPQKILKEKNNCIEVMTGCILPKNTSTVIRYEDLTKEGDFYQVNVEVKDNLNIHQEGEDSKERDLILPKGKLLEGIDINVLATVGKGKVKVRKLPNVAVISSGEELVDIHKTLEPYQIRKSNVYMLQACLKKMNIHSTAYHLRDDLKNIKEKIKNIERSNDIILMSGGVSMGKFDFIPQALEELGYRKLFHKVKQRPGKPFWFGRKDDKVVFAFPGNPVSSLACFHKYFKSWYRKCLGIKAKEMIARLRSDIIFKPDLTYFAQARHEWDENGTLWAEVIHGHGSGDMINPTSVSGFLELSRGKEVYIKGEPYKFIPF